MSLSDEEICKECSGRGYKLSTSTGWDRYIYAEQQTCLACKGTGLNLKGGKMDIDKAILYWAVGTIALIAIGIALNLK
jgi:hypothetical protein